MTVLELVEQHRIVAIVRLDDLSIAPQLAQALINGGIRAIEFTLTNPDAVGAGCLGLIVGSRHGFKSHLASVGAHGKR